MTPEPAALDWKKARVVRVVDLEVDMETEAAARAANIGLWVACQVF